MNLKRPYLGLKWLTGSVFTAHLILGWVLPENNVVVDLILFNLIGIAAAAIAFNAPLITDRISANSFGLAALSSAHFFQHGTPSLIYKFLKECQISAM